MPPVGPELAPTRRRVPDPFEFGSVDQILAPVLAELVEAGLAQASVVVLLVVWSVAQDWPGVVNLYLADQPAVVIDLEVPVRMSPTVVFVAANVISTTTKERLAIGEVYGSRGRVSGGGTGPAVEARLVYG
jgi:hypothetical protein